MFEPFKDYQDTEHIMSKLIKISMYILNKVFGQWYLNIVAIISFLRFKENYANLYIYFF